MEKEATQAAPTSCSFHNAGPDMRMRTVTAKTTVINITLPAIYWQGAKGFPRNNFSFLKYLILTQPSESGVLVPKTGKQILRP